MYSIRRLLLVPCVRYFRRTRLVAVTIEYENEVTCPLCGLAKVEPNESSLFGFIWLCSARNDRSRCSGSEFVSYSGVVDGGSFMISNILNELDKGKKLIKYCMTFTRCGMIEYR